MDNYKPSLANRLTFPENWAAIVINIFASGCHWHSFITIEGAKDMLRICDNAVGMNGRAWLFTNWNEVLEAMNGPEMNNRQFHVMVDLISWHLVGPGMGHGLEPAPELPFDIPPYGGYE
jgi:hypothetical protein